MPSQRSVHSAMLVSLRPFKSKACLGTSQDKQVTGADQLCHMWFWMYCTVRLFNVRKNWVLLLAITYRRPPASMNVLIKGAGCSGLGYTIMG